MEEKISWQKEIDFQCSFGVWPFKKTLEISPNGFLWCGELFPLKKITRLRWGVDQSRGGIFPRRTCIATFGTVDREFTIKTKQKDFYAYLTDKYWKAVGRRLLSEMLDCLGEGRSYTFGKDTTVSDAGITVRERGTLSKGRDSFYAWEELRWGVVNGNLCFAPANASDKLLVGLSFLWIDNVHVLNVALALLDNSKDKKKLSTVDR